MPRTSSKWIPADHGFSTIEVIATLLLVGILAVVVAGRMVDTTAELVAESAIVKAHLRFAQSRAMNAEVPWGIRFDGASYTLLTDGLTSSALLPAESSATHFLQAGSASASINPVVFDQWGSPGTSDITITVSTSSGSKSIMITKDTGFIP